MITPYQLSFQKISVANREEKINNYMLKFRHEGLCSGRCGQYN